jgi:hypothetical protein
VDVENKADFDFFFRDVLAKGASSTLDDDADMSITLVFSPSEERFFCFSMTLGINI